jgi:DNA polymerase III subunit beta
MKLTITREQLQEGLVAVAASVPAKTTLPILSNILLEATKDGIRLSGTDLDISVSTTVSASVDQEGAITLPARKLVEIVRELPSAAIRLTASGEQRVTIECGRSKFRLLGLPREEFPAFPTVKFEGGWRTSSKDLQKLIAHVAFAASTEESRPILNGVLWEPRPISSCRPRPSSRFAACSRPTRRSRSPGARTIWASARPRLRSSPG